MMSPLPTGTVTFLFTDIEGSTKGWQQHPEGMKTALARHNTLLRQVIESNGGFVFQIIGDAFCAAFPTASDALAAAIAAQRELQSTFNVHESMIIRVRMGVHTGTAEMAGNTYASSPTLIRVTRLMSAGHGGQILLSQAAHDLVQDEMPSGVALLDLGEHHLKDLLRPERIFQVNIPGLPQDFPALRTTDTLPNNLPIPTTSFIGRERDMAEIKRLLSGTRLVTLTGVGGTGKTRLCLQVATELLATFNDGTWLIEFAPVTDPALVTQAVAAAIGLHEEPFRPILSTLVDYLLTRRVLLILDNCEHLIAACAELAETILQKCPHVSMLASSREPLAIPGEVAWSVPSLGVPDPKNIMPVDALSQVESVRLFLDRALAVQPTFKLTSTNAQAVTQICFRLDGIPLAIELAAARVRALTVDQMAVRLVDRFRLLTGGSRTALPRHRTLQATIDWSYDLLSAGERTLLRQLSVFVGGWTLEAAEEVATTSHLPLADVLDPLAHLVEKSLVALDDQGSTNRRERYRMLETIRQYALDKLLHSDESDQVRTHHFNYYLRLAEQAEAKLSGAEQMHWLEILELEHDNSRAALDWALAGSRVELALRLAGTLPRFWELRGYLSEGRERLAAILARARTSQPSGAFARALAGAGQLAYRQSDYSASRSYFEESMAVCRQLNDKSGIAVALNGLGNIATEIGDYETAPVLFLESLVLGRELNDMRRIGLALTNLGWASMRPGDYPGAEKYLTEALSVYQAMEDRVGTALAFSGLGEVALRQNDLERASRILEKSLALRRELGIKWGIAASLGSLGWIALRQHHTAKALALLGESLTVRREIGDKGGMAWCLERLAELAQLAAQPARAAQIFGAAGALRTRMGSVIDPVDQSAYETHIASLKTTLGESQFPMLWDEGQTLSLDQALAAALGIETQQPMGNE